VAEVRLQARVPRAAAHAYAERIFLFLGYGLACWLVARRIPLQEVLYADPPASVARSEVPRLFETAVRDGAPQPGWRFDAAWLDLPVVQNAQSWAEFLRQAPANLLVRYRDQSTVTERIRRLLRRHLADELPTLEAVGAQLSMTPQTLRRRLRDEGQGFQALKDDLRRDAAIACLARPDLSLADIARQLGFSEASTFHRAFKQWTGVAPGAYRQRQRCDSAGPADRFGQSG
jgi:AraC-like DNA-binding protein